MPRCLITLLAAAHGAGLSACCSFVPCHPAITVAGRVASASGEPVSGALINVHGMTGTSDDNGCFLLHGADALPFEMRVQAQGFEPLRVDIQAGSYQAIVVLVAPNTGRDSEAHLSKSRAYPAKPVPGCA
jgi:carboxypeptidase family protein